MNKTQYEHQRQIANLIPIIELCLPLTEKLDRTKSKLDVLPRKLESLKETAQFLKQYNSQMELQTVSSYSNSSISQQQNWCQSSKTTGRSRAEETELELDYVVNQLDEILDYLTNFKQEINNIIVLKERLEALQEERLDSITPERIYSLLEAQSADLNRNSPRSSYWQNLRCKIASNQKFLKLATTTTIALGIISCFSIISSSVKYQEVEQNTVEETETIDKTSVEL